MIWGYALVWARPFLERDPDPLMARLKFLHHYGLQTTGIGLRQVTEMDSAQRDRVGQYLADHDLSLTIHVGADFFNSDLDVARRQQDEVA